MDISKWSEIIDNCLNKVADRWPETVSVDKPIAGGKSTETITGIIFSGNMHETVPKQLLLDSRLTPIERNAWQVFKLLLDKQGFAAPKYEDLQPYLSMTPYGEKASKETVAKSIHLLRLTGWLSLITKGRDKQTGQLLGSLYILHDEPLSAIESVQLDKDYIDYVDKCCNHASKNVSIVAKNTLIELQNTDNTSIKTRLSVLTERIEKRVENTPDRLKKQTPPDSKNHLVRNNVDLSSESEPSKNAPVRNSVNPSSESEPSLHSPISNSVRNPNLYSTSTVYINTSTVLEHPKLQSMDQQQRSKLIELLSTLDNQLLNQVIDEFDKRCNDNIKNPIGYLFGLLKKAKNNEFKPWLSTVSSVITDTSSAQSYAPTSPIKLYRRDTSKPIPMEIQQQMQNIKNLFSANKI